MKGGRYEAAGERYPGKEGNLEAEKRMKFTFLKAINGALKSCNRKSVEIAELLAELCDASFSPRRSPLYTPSYGRLG